MPTADAKHPFPKDCRLKSSLLIKETVQQRRSVFSFPIKCFYRVTETPGVSTAKAAFLVSKKRFAHAVDRNRVKRLLREAYRLHNQALAIPENQTILLCWMFVGDTLPSFAQVEESSLHLFHDLQAKIIPEKP